MITSMTNAQGRGSTVFVTLLVLALALSGDVRSAWCSASDAPGLMELARNRFSDLTQAELALLKFVGSNPAIGGGFAAAGPSANPEDPNNDPAQAAEWSKDRQVRAQLIRLAVRRS